MLSSWVSKIFQCVFGRQSETKNKQEVQLQLVCHGVIFPKKICLCPCCIPVLLYALFYVLVCVCVCVCVCVLCVCTYACACMCAFVRVCGLIPQIIVYLYKQAIDLFATARGWISAAIL